MHYEEITGIIDRFLFQNQENGFCVFILQLPKESITAKGSLPSINAGQQVTLKGSWIIHPKFGKQFEVISCKATLPTSSVGLKKYLGSGLIKGIGPAYAEKMVNYFGTNILEIIDKNPERLIEVPGIGNGRAQKIITAWHDQKEISNVMLFLQERNIPTSYAVKIYKTYGQNSIKIVQENPYRLADEIWGIGFKTADTIAQSLGLEKDCQERMRAGILFSISTQVSNGHIYIELQDLTNKTLTLLELQDSHEPKLKGAFRDLYDQNKIKLISYENKNFIALSQHYFCEKGIATKIEKISSYANKECQFNYDAIYRSLNVKKHERDTLLNEEQQKGILTALQNKITIITGGPGTGKTTLIKKLLGILDEYSITYRLAAPTGRAAKRITEGTGRNASTIHRLLEYDFTTLSFAHNEQNALKLDFLIVDEASMIDVFLAHALLKALPLHAHLVLIGDVDQLPSVGPGNILNDLIASKKVATIRLHQIFRQAQDSLIIVNAHRINHGEFPLSYAPDAKKDFIFIKEENPENMPLHLTNIFNNQLARSNIQPQEAVVLVPMNRGGVGTQAINQTLQTLLNPQSDKQLTHAGTAFKLHDRVMQIRNNYDKLVFNGDIGTIEDIDLDDRILKISFSDRIVEYEHNEMDELVLAYSITIHKSQGSEFAAAIIPLFMQHFTLLQRNLLYTAITRAKKLCILIGQPKAIGMAIGNNKGVARTTFLQQFLTSDLQCR